MTSNARERRCTAPKDARAREALRHERRVRQLAEAEADQEEEGCQESEDRREEEEKNVISPSSCRYGVISILFLSFSSLGADEGASHWAWKPISSPTPPSVEESSWGRNEIDAFILARLEREGVRPSLEAPRTTLIRRVFLDVIGLPPSPDEYRRWNEHTVDDWYEQLLDTLLASPHYAERWGRHWLDQARFADTDGYEKDQPRPHAYHWRDWVIDALHRDLPFDQFTVQQIAGDLLPGATESTRLATGFHRNTLTNREGGIDREEDRVKQVVDRVNTVSTVWLGLTVRCAQCHTHKYDPITQDEYFQLYAFFNNADEQDFPLAPTETELASYRRAVHEHESEIAQKTSELTAKRDDARRALPEFTAKLLAEFPDGIATPPTNGLRVHLPFEKLEGANFHGQVEPTEGRVGRAVKLDGKGSHAEFADPAAIDSDDPFTISAWIRPGGGGEGIVTKIDEPRDFRGIDFTSHRGELEVHLVHKWPTDAIKVTAKTRLRANDWQHVVLTYDGSKKAAGVRVFIDGKSQELKVHYDTLKGSFRVDQPWRVGRRRTTTFFSGSIDEVRLYERALNTEEVSRLAGNDAALVRALEIAAKSPASRQVEEIDALVDYSLRKDATSRKLRADLEKLRKNPPKQSHGTGMGLVERKDPRKTFVHLRGDFLQKGDEVHESTPGFLHALEIRDVDPDRLDLARWIVSPENTLTRRVTVNRVWQQYFGRGLVESSDDFGTQGTPPTHPDLLDWLATRFADDGWSLKKLHRRILSSATYRQSSKPRHDLAERDPRNTWFASQNRLRVEAEIVRDLALSVSGLLVRKVKGPSVYPPLPPGVVELAFVDVINRGPWRASRGEDRYRRGLYTFYQRTSPHPQLAMFDAPDSNTACVRRERSNTPLQSLTIWNDSVFVECAQAFAKRTLVDEKNDTTSRLRFAFRTALAREPESGELEDLKRLYEISRSIYARDDAGRSLARGAAAGINLPDGVDETELAAWLAVTRALINLDEFITRE